uniref:Uncharacterized protein n=1 Tax=Salix viminalis TaxID=40686 RepID=A0A6N2LZV7_SALVM
MELKRGLVPAFYDFVMGGDGRDYLIYLFGRLSSFCVMVLSLPLFRPHTETKASAGISTNHNINTSPKANAVPTTEIWRAFKDCYIMICYSNVCWNMSLSTLSLLEKVLILEFTCAALSLFDGH